MTDVDLDLQRAQEVFATSADNTVGVEEEFAILDQESLDLVGLYERLRGAGAADEVLAQAICGELISSEIEIVSGRGESVRDALDRQRQARQRLFALAESNGVRLAATGTHPWADYRDQAVIDTDHYHRVEDGLKYVAWRNNTFSLHVHVGVRDPDRAVRVCDRLRPVLPTLLALSSNSPYLDGRDSGLASARTQTFTRSFPRCGVPDPFGGWDAYRRYIDFLVQTNSIVEFTQVWWSIRPHFRFGTVEVRICDAQSTARESDALVALIAACVAQAARDVDEGVPSTDLPGRLIEENIWRAIRFGVDASLIDLPHARERPARAAVEDLLAWTAPVRGELSIEIDLPPRNGVQRQRALSGEGASMEEVFTETVKETHETYGQEAER